MPEARYRIAACDYQVSGALIERVLINIRGSWRIASRASIATMVEQQPQLCWTWVADDAFEYTFGAPLRVSGLFLTTGKGDIKKDVLEHLPRILHCPFKEGTMAVSLTEDQRTVAATLRSAREVRERIAKARVKAP